MATGGARLLPLELLDRTIGSRVTCLMRGEQQVDGTLLGFDDYCNVVLADCVTYDNGEETQRLDQMLLNGNGICAFIPGGIPS
mmetsp:Transcript_22986/g.45865  ORF Transcript_22986/g.45865 Transcript_22986/m.45865 type:complete len:83 (-) Transcript_22986:9-257(-)